MAATAMNQVWWTIGEVAARWRVSADSIHRRIKDGSLPAMRVGGAWRIHQDEIERREKSGLSKKSDRKPRRQSVELPDLVGDLNDV